MASSEESSGPPASEASPSAVGDEIVWAVDAVVWPLSRLMMIRASTAVSRLSRLTSSRVAFAMAGRLPSRSPRRTWLLIALITISASMGVILPSTLTSSGEDSPMVMD